MGMDCITGNIFNCKYAEKCPNYVGTEMRSIWVDTTKKCLYGMYMADEILLDAGKKVKVRK
jgi:hypothetical protein